MKKITTDILYRYFLENTPEQVEERIKTTLRDELRSNEERLQDLEHLDYVDDHEEYSFIRNETDLKAKEITNRFELIQLYMGRFLSVIYPEISISEIFTEKVEELKARYNMPDATPEEVLVHKAELANQELLDSIKETTPELVKELEDCFATPEIDERYISNQKSEWQKEVLAGKLTSPDRFERIVTGRCYVPATLKEYLLSVAKDWYSKNADL